VDLLIAKRVLRWPEWLRLVAIVVLSSLPIIGRSLANEFLDLRESLDVIVRHQGPNS
jgi:hypothetical protein